VLVVVTFVFCVAVTFVNVVNVVAVLNGFVATVFTVLVVFNGVFCLLVFGSSGHDCLLDESARASCSCASILPHISTHSNPFI